MSSASMSGLAEGSRGQCHEDAQMTARLYRIGQWVQVARTVKAVYLPDNQRTGVSERVLEVTDAGWEAAITGARRVKLGYRNPGTAYYDTMDDHEPPSFTPTRTILVWCTRRGTTNREVISLPQHIRSTEDNTGAVPWFHNPDPGSWKWSRAWDKASIHALRRPIGLKAKGVTVCGILCDRHDHMLRIAMYVVEATCPDCLDAIKAKEVSKALLVAGTDQ